MKLCMNIPAALPILIAANALAQPAIDWHTVDGGGGRSSGAIYTITGTIAQTDACDTLSGITFSIGGGFWNGTTTPPCPADFNHDGAADFFDYLDFVDAFSSNDPGADFNGDTAIDFFDYLDFVDAFSVGC